MAKHRRHALSLATLMVLLVICTACSPRQDVPADEQPVPISPQAAADLEARLGSLSGPSFQLQVSDEEATSYVALRLGDQVPLSAPQIRFSPAEVLVEGTLTSPFRAPARLSATVQVTAGRLELSVRQAHIGGVAIPKFLLASLSENLSEMINDSLAAGAIEVQEITIGAGRIVVSGYQQER